MTETQLYWILTIHSLDATRNLAYRPSRKLGDKASRQAEPCYSMLTGLANTMYKLYDKWIRFDLISVRTPDSPVAVNA